MQDLNEARASALVLPHALVPAVSGHGRWTSERPLMRFALFGLLFAAVLFLITGGHLLFLPLFFLLPLGGMFGHHQRHGHFWFRGRRRL